MTKTSFLQDSHVREMLIWFSARCGDVGFTHGYRDRTSGEPWACDGLHHAFTSYRWNRAAWTKNKRELDHFRERLREGVTARDKERVFSACVDVLKWGGVWANNGKYLEGRRDVLIDEIVHFAGVLAADREPTKAEIRRDPRDAVTECRMNAGFVKIYSVLLDHFVIYDGRVGAALGLMTRRFCEETGRSEVPAALRFAYGSAKEALNAAAPKTRNPSVGRLRFPKLHNDSHFPCVQAMRASWFLRAALESGRGAFSPGEDGFHEVAAALFMIGYDLPASRP